MLKRIAQHYVGIKKKSEKKYQIMAEAQQKGYSINFDVLYYAKSRTYADRLAEIGEKEGEFIRQYQPILNTQIPNEDDWHTWTVKSIDAKSVLDTIL